MTINDDVLNNEIDIEEQLSGNSGVPIYVDSTAVADNDILQYDSATGKFDTVTITEAGFYAVGGTDVAVADGGTGASTAAAARTNLGLGTIATQNSNAIAITGGTISGLSTLGASAAAITGGTITGITDLAVADGGTGASTLTGIIKGNGTSAFTAGATVTVAEGGTGATTLTGVLQGNGTSAITAGTVTVPLGGTGVTSATAYGTLIAGTTSTGAFQVVAPGTANYVLTSNGAAAAPTYQSPGSVTNKYVFISTQTASASATIDFTGLDNTYQLYFVQIDNVVPGTDNVILQMRVGTGGTPTYDSGSNYGWSTAAVHTTGTEVNGGSSSQTEMQLVPTGSNTTQLGSSTGENMSGIVYVNNPSNSSLYKVCAWKLGGYSAGAVPVSAEGGGVYKSTTAVTAIRFLMSSGTIASGTFTLYGVKNS